MKGSKSFEEKLKRQTLRPVPAAWREEILAAARKAADERAVGECANSGRGRGGGWLTNILWPHPIAWGGLAATWLVIIGLNMAASDPAGPKLARGSSPPSPEQRELLREQEQLFAELLGPAEKLAVAVEPKRRGAQPRSQARAQFINV